jgi:purine-binding chemotaxis protein CheW
VNLAFDENKEDIVQLVGFYVGQKFFGTDILTVREILRDPVIEIVDQAPDSISGMVQLRGRTIPIVDLKRRLEDNSNNGERGQKWVLIAQVGEITLGFIADAVTRIFRIDPSSIFPAPELILSRMATRYIRGVCESELGMLVILELNRILTGDEIKALKKIAIH